MPYVGALSVAAAEEGSGGGLALILPHGAELLWGIISFVIVAAFLMKIAFPRLRQAVEEREKRIQNELEEAERARTEAQQKLDEYKRQLSQARGEANRVIEDARQQAEQVRKDMIARAESDAQQVVDRAQQQIEAERNRTVQELQGSIADLSIELAEKVVGRSLDGESQRSLVDAYIREVGAMRGNGSSR